MTDSNEMMIQKAKQGDTEAFRALVEKFQNFAFHVAYRFLHSETDAMDTVQESFIRVWQHLPRYNQNKRFSTWFYRIVVNSALDRIRKNTRRSEIPFERIPEIKADCDPESACIRQEFIQKIRDTAETLPDKQRTVFTLRDLQEFSIREVAEILHCTQQTVKSHLYYARKKIRLILAAGGDGK